MTMVDFDPYQHQHRKPMPFATAHNNNGIQPLTKIVPDNPYRPQKPSYQPQSTSSHAHTRTISSSVFPNPHTSPSHSTYPPTTTHTNRRTPSNATASSTMTSTTSSPHRAPSTTSHLSLRRSTSSRSGQSSSPTSYVALMRKQKATVWCDRAQHEDPRLVAQAKAAKHRATLEIVGSTTQHSSGSSANRTGTGLSSSLGVRSKIRHHTAPKTSPYTSANLVGSGVPMRLSASEVGDEEDSDDETDSGRHQSHVRSGSGRSSLASTQRLAAYGHRTPTARLSQSSTPPSNPASPPASDPAETPVPSEVQRRNNAAAAGVGGGGGAVDYFGIKGTEGAGGSGSSSERESSFGAVGDLKVVGAVGEGGKDELSRRGSVDERAMTMRGAVRLFVANPDLSD